MDNNSNGLCVGMKTINQEEFYKELFKFTFDEQIMLITDEDYLNSRSHFSPSMVNRSPRDNYLVRLTKMLFDRLRETASINGSNFFVFFPVREDSERASALIKCIQKREPPNTKFPIKIDSLSLLKEVLPSERLIYFDLIGGNELSVSLNDRHLSDIGNEKAMNILASLITNKK